jgi:glycosyltransferase involved in cell wall biosynthesis
VLEAMMAGVPVVTGRFGSISEVGGAACVYVDSRSAEALAAGMAEVLGWDAKTRADRVEQGRRHAATFSWNRTAAQTIAALEEAAGGSQKP